MTTVESQTIGASCEVGDGTHSKIPREDSGVLYLTCRNFKEGRVDYSNVYFISEENFGKYFKSGKKALICPRPGDLVFSIIGTIGEPYLVRPTDRFGISSSVAIVRPKPESIDPKFLYYWMRSPRFQGELFAIKGGVAQGYVSLEMIKSLPAPTLPISTQRKIAGILSAYDDLIENNLRRIKILEEMAQSLYREWFVHFRFPGHDSMRFIDSELGRIPKGWKVTTIGEQFTTTLGGTPSRSNDAFWTNGTVPWVNSGKVNELRIIAPTSFITEEALRRSAAKLMPARTTVIAITGATLGQVSLLEIECSANQSVIGITDDESRLSEWLYLFFSEKIYEVIQHASGGAQQHINKEIVNDVRLVLPDDNTAHNFGGKISPIFDQQSNLLRRNQNLRRTRDLLLPKLLMSND